MWSAGFEPGFSVLSLSPSSATGLPPLVNMSYLKHHSDILNIALIPYLVPYWRISKSTQKMGLGFIVMCLGSCLWKNVYWWSCMKNMYIIDTRWLSSRVTAGLVGFLCHLVISACYIQFASMRLILFYNLHVLAMSYYLHVSYLCFVRFLIF